MQLEYFSIFQQLYHRFLALVLSLLKLPKTTSLIPEIARATGKLRNNGAETNCRIAHILGILLMNSCNTDIFFSNYYHWQSVRFEFNNNYETENTFFVFLSSYKNTCNSLGELEKAVETLACGSCSHSISRSPKLSRVFL